MGTPIPKTPEEKRANLARLADYLDALPEDYALFDMSTYYHQSPARCGTIACAVGHGPAAGIGPTADTVERQLGWIRYAAIYLGVDRQADHRSHRFLFDGAWCTRDNTPRGAARRIRHWLEHGTPPGGTVREWKRGAPYVSE